MITIEQKTGEILQNYRPITNLAPLEKASLLFFLANPKQFLTKSQIIKNSWPEDVQPEGVTDDAVYRVICSIRRKLRRPPFENKEYIQTWRGIRGGEGGYRFFPNGQVDFIEESHLSSSSFHLLEEIVEHQEMIIQLLTKTEQLIQNIKSVQNGL